MARRLRIFLLAAAPLVVAAGVFLFISKSVQAAPYFSPPTLSITGTTSTSVSLAISNVHPDTDYMYLYKNGAYYSYIWGSVTVGSLPCGTHSFYVVAESMYGVVVNSNEVSATPQACPTMTGPSLSGGAGGQTSINLAWNDPNTNEQGYRVYRGGSLIATLGANSTSYTDSGRLCGTSYSYYVQAYNTTTGQSASSNTVNVSTSACPDNSPPNAAPSSLRKLSSTPTSISLAWNDNSTNEDGFFLYRGGSKIADLGSGSTSYTSSSLSCNTSYSFSVTAYKKYLNDPLVYQTGFWHKMLSKLGLSNIVQAADQYIYVETSASSTTAYTSSCDTTAPSVSSLSPSAGTSYSSESYNVTVSYTDGTGVANVQYCTSPYGTCSPSSTAATSSVTVSVTSATTYFCHRATDVVGNQSSTSCATYYLKPTSPIDISATYNYGAQTVTISWWDTSTKETRFDIARSGAQSGSFTASAVSGTGFTSYTDTTKPVAGTYTYSVSACNSAGCSSAYSSNTISRPADDTTPPSGSINIQSGWDTTASSSNSVTVSCSDSGSGCASWTVYSNSASCSGTVAGSGSGSSGTATVTLSPANNTVYASVKVTDNAGNYACFSDSIFYDTQVPSGSVSINNGAATTSSQNVTLNMTCSDNSGGAGGIANFPFNNKYTFVTKLLDWLGLDNYALAAVAPPNGIVGCQQAKVYVGTSSCSGTPVATLNQPDGATSTSVTLPGTGTQYASVEFMDGAGNATCASDSITVGSAPTACTSVTVTNANSDADAGYTKVLPTFQCNGSSGGAVSEYRRTVYYNGSYATQSIGTSSVTVPNFGNGTYTVSIEPHNSVGYASVNSGTIYLDTTNPAAGNCTFNRTVNSNGWINVLPVTASVTFTDNTAGTLIKNCTISSPGANVSCSASQTDRAGNTSSKTCTVNVDVTAPGLSQANAKQAGSSSYPAIANTTSNANAATFKVQVTDSLSGISGGDCRLMKGEQELRSGGFSSGICELSVPFTPGISNNGSDYSIVGTVNDNAGNSYSVNQGFIIQNSAPSIITN